MDGSVSAGRARAPVKLYSIQYLRGIAALMVVLCHASTALFRRERGLVDLLWGKYGVDLFFAISGSIMVISTSGRASTPFDFMVRRVIRIFPLYFVLTTLLLFLVTFVIPDSYTAVPSLPEYLKSILFVPYWNRIGPAVQPILGQGWTLNYEMFFYVIFALGLLCPKRLGVPLMIAALSSLCVAGAPYAGRSPYMRIYASPLMLEFCLGMLVGHALLRVSAPEKAVSWRVLGLGALILTAATAAGLLLMPRSGFYPDSIFRFLEAGTLASAILYLVVRWELSGKLPHNRPLQILGDASYSLYLSHAFVQGTGRRIWQHFFDDSTLLSHWGFIGTMTVICIGAGLCTYYLIERPLTNALNRAWQSSGRRAQAAATVPPA